MSRGDAAPMKCPCCGAALFTCKCDVAIIDRDPVRLGWRRCEKGTHKP